jgi:3-phosphoshikimate 1-carboxyvinyltransferase
VSSASFLVAAALITGKALTIHGCGINPTRCGFLDAACRMGASSEIVQEDMQLGEPVGSISIHPAPLRGATVSPEEVPDLIDEIPLIAVLGLFADGRTEVKGASELRVKESDRLAMIQRMVESLGGKLELFDDGFAVDGPQKLRSGLVDPQGDHRIAMAAAVAGAGIPGGVKVTGFDCSQVSYPDFIRDFTSLGGEVT